MAYMDSKCSGRQTCTILIATLEAVAQPCDKDFKSYLQATYSCVPGRISCAGDNQKELLRFQSRSQVEGESIESALFFRTCNLFKEAFNFLLHLKQCAVIEYKSYFEILFFFKKFKTDDIT